MEIESVRLQSILEIRQNFYARIQKKGEKFTDFLNDVKNLAKYCHFKNMTESLIRDRILFGLWDVKLKNDLIESGGDPKLDHIVAICETFELKNKENQQFVEDRVNNEPSSSGQAIDDAGATHGGEGAKRRRVSDDAELDDIDNVDEIPCCCINFRKKILSQKKELEKAYVHVEQPNQAFTTEPSQDSSYYENTTEENGEAVEDDDDDDPDDDDHNDDEYDEEEEPEYLNSSNFDGLLEQPIDSDVKNYIPLGNTMVLRDVITEIHTRIPSGIAYDTEFLKLTILHLWTRQELAQRMACQASSKVCEQRQRRPCTPQKKHFLLRQLRKRVRSENCTESQVKKRATMAIVNKQIRSIIGNERQKIKKLQRR